MHFSKSAFSLAIGAVGIMTAMATHAATLSNGNQLTITAGVNAYDANGNFTNVSSGSWFAWDMNGNSNIAGIEKHALSMGTTGIITGVATSAGASHLGAPDNTDTNAITAPWEFLGNTGSDYTTIGITGSTENGLNMSGWTVTWNGRLINTRGGAWGTGFIDGVGNLTLSGINDFYTLDYHATVPLNDPSGFGGLKYALHLEGYCSTPEGCDLYPTPTTPTPEASTYTMMLAGLGLVGLAARRRRNE